MCAIADSGIRFIKLERTGRKAAHADVEVFVQQELAAHAVLVDVAYFSVAYLAAEAINIKWVDIRFLRDHPCVNDYD
jgi:hypothetical protein